MVAATWPLPIGDVVAGQRDVALEAPGRGERHARRCTGPPGSVALAGDRRDLGAEQVVRPVQPPILEVQRRSRPQAPPWATITPSAPSAGTSSSAVMRKPRLRRFGATASGSDADAGVVLVAVAPVAAVAETAGLVVQRQHLVALGLRPPQVDHLGAAARARPRRGRRSRRSPRRRGTAPTRRRRRAASGRCRRRRSPSIGWNATAFQPSW